MSFEFVLSSISGGEIYSSFLAGLSIAVAFTIGGSVCYFLDHPSRVKADIAAFGAGIIIAVLKLPEITKKSFEVDLNKGSEMASYSRRTIYIDKLQIHNTSEYISVDIGKIGIELELSLLQVSLQKAFC